MTALACAVGGGFALREKARRIFKDSFLKCASFVKCANVAASATPARIWKRVLDG